MTQLPPNVIPNIFFQLLIQYLWAIGIAILVVFCIYFSYNEKGKKPKKKKSKYPDFEMDLGPP